MRGNTLQWPCASARTAVDSLNGVISDKYEVIITRDVFLDHNYLQVLRRERSEALLTPGLICNYLWALFIYSPLDRLISGTDWRHDNTSNAGVFTVSVENWQMWNI